MGQKKDDKKVYVVDTSVLMNDPSALERLLPGNVVIIPIWVIEELDRKKRQDESARMASRLIEQYSDKKGQFEKLADGIKTANGGKLIVEHRSAEWGDLPEGLERSTDNRILLVARYWQKKGGFRVIVLSCDTNLRIKAQTLGLEAETYHYDEMAAPVETLYSGVAQIQLRPEQAGLLQRINNERVLPIADLGTAINGTNPLPNQCCFLICGDRYQLAIYEKDSKCLRPVPKPHRSENGHEDKGKSLIQPINDEQAFAYSMLMNPKIGIITLVGPAGTGKTLIALTAAYRQLNHAFQQILVFRPNIELGQQIGFLPGEIGEKFRPWMAPVFDNMQLIVDGHPKNKGDDPDSYDVSKTDAIKDLMDLRLLAIEPINFVRGRSLNGAFIIVDEAQNLTRLQVKTIITRVGAGAKIVLIGDPSQIDNPHLNSISNGLVRVVEAFKGQDNFGHISLDKCERSDIANLAAQLL